MLSAQLLRVADEQQIVKRSLSVAAGVPLTNRAAVSLSTTESAAVGFQHSCTINCQCGQLPSLLLHQQRVVSGDPLQLQLCVLGAAAAVPCR